MNDDVYRYYGRYHEKIVEKFRRTYGMKYIFIYRKYNSTNNIFLKTYYKILQRRLQKKSFIHIPLETKIGKGFYIGHDGPIIINSNVIIGNNCNITNGVTIGQENRGIRKGTPIIGNEVWIGANAVIVGNITIGDDVLIAPNAYVNFDVPSHSIVIGNPAKIIHSDYATKDYINRKI